jgi:hypothetical protein
MPILRLDRLEAITDELVAGIDRLDVLSNLPPTFQAPLRLLARMGFDLPALVRAEVRTSVARMPSAARSDPARADRIAVWLVHVAAWLTDQTDEPPPPLNLDDLLPLAGSPPPATSSPGSNAATG